MERFARFFSPLSCETISAPAKSRLGAHPSFFPRDSFTAEGDENWGGKIFWGAYLEQGQKEFDVKSAHAEGFSKRGEKNDGQ